MAEKIKIFGHPWHLAHQYELSKIPFIEWSWLVQYKRPYSKQARGDFKREPFPLNHISSSP